MNERDLHLSAGASTSVIAKLGKDKNVNTVILLKICNALYREFSDIMEIER
jgi:DNA-binding Xre family transcriptional regulator